MNKDKVIRCIQDFFEEEHIKEVIATIKECQVSGWEGWIQVEFAHYLQKKVYKDQKANFSWYREYKVHSSGDNHIIPDFWISSDEDEISYFLIEFKRSNSGKLEDEMKVDVEKWRNHIAINQGKLYCPTDNKTYNNLGVFFVGVDTNPANKELHVEGVTLENYGKQSQYRIDFLSVI